MENWKRAVTKTANEVLDNKRKQRKRKGQNGRNSDTDQRKT